jgi:hypothetical protein
LPTLLPFSQEWPAGHGFGSVVPLPQIWPAGHGPLQLRLVAPGEYPAVPAGHGMQKPAEGAPSWSLYVPAGHNCRWRAWSSVCAQAEPTGHSAQSKTELFVPSSKAAWMLALPQLRQNDPLNCGAHWQRGGKVSSELQ